MLLEDKNAVIYGGGGSIGGAVARASPAKEPGTSSPVVSSATLDEVAEGIRSTGGLAETAESPAAPAAPRSVRSYYSPEGNGLCGLRAWN